MLLKLKNVGGKLLYLNRWKSEDEKIDGTPAKLLLLRNICPSWFKRPLGPKTSQRPLPNKIT